MANPLDQFLIKTIIPLEMMGHNISFTNSSLLMILSVSAALLFFYMAIRSAKLVPNRLQMTAELIHDMVLDMVDKNAGSKARPFFPLVFSVFLFILFCNLLGMVPGSFTVTSHIIVTFALAMMVFLTVTATGFIRHGFHFFELFVPKGTPLFLAPMMFLLEMISYLVRPCSLAVRLFANMLAGHILLKVFAGMSVAFGVGLGLLPLIMNIALTGFEFFVAFIQAYIFAILSSVYLHDALEMH